MAYVKCKCCGYKEEANKTFFLKVMGGSFVGGGFTAWVTYFFAGTGFAFGVCVAILCGCNVRQHGSISKEVLCTSLLVKYFLIFGLQRKNL